MARLHRSEDRTDRTGQPPGDRDDPIRPRTFAVGLGLIAGVGAILRVSYLYAHRTSVVWSDGLHYSMAGRYVADGRGFINPIMQMTSGTTAEDALHPPAWTLILAGSASLGWRSDLQFQLLAAAVGVATIVMVGLAASAAFNRRVGLIAAFLAALYPNFWLYERELVSEPLALLGCATLLWLVYRFRASPSSVRAVALGAVVALCALTRSELIMLSVLVVAPAILGGARRFPLARRAAWGAMAGAACVVLISPWFLFNTTRFAAPVPLSDGLGPAMSAGNCDATYDPDNEVFAYYHFGCVIYGGATSTDLSVADGEYRASSFRYMKAHAGQVPWVALARVGRTFSLYAPFQQVGFEAERGSTPWVLSAALWCYWALLPFAVAGAFIARRRNVAIYPLMGLVIVVVLAVIPTIGAARYRVPAGLALVVLAAVSFDALIRRWRDAPGPTGAGSDPVTDLNHDPVAAASTEENTGAAAPTLTSLA